MKKLISYVIPAYNEEGNVEALYRRLLSNAPHEYRAEYIFVDDGSGDNTLIKIKKIARKNPAVKYISFTRNFGHQYAIKAGLDFAKGSAVVSLDADLQNPPELIPKMIKKWEKGIKIVYSRRISGQGKMGKDAGSSFFYRVINAMSETKIDAGSADFRLLDREVVDLVKNSDEATLFLRGLVAWSGWESAVVEYLPGTRQWGETKYSFSKMFQLAVDAITSFSTLPLRLATLIGLVMSLLSGIYGLYAIWAWVSHKSSVIIGWPSVIISVLFIGGLQLMILGIIGEYVGKIFMETKNRPLYIIKEKQL